MISIDWGARVIFVPKVDLTLVQLSPTEIYNMDLNWFRLQLKDIEDGEDGICFPSTHNHNTEVSLGGLTFARVIEIINDYTLTFEDGQYAVNLIGANSNVADRVNVNQVSVRSANSAGLISSPAIEYSSYNEGVTVDILSSYTGTIFPIGTPQAPVNNLSDAFLICQYRGFDSLFIKGDITLTSGIDVSNYTLIGEGSSVNTPKTSITMSPGCITSETIFKEAYISGTQGGECKYDKCVIGETTNMHCLYNDTILIGPMTLSYTTAPWLANHISNYKNCQTSKNPFILNYNNSPVSMVHSNFSGRMTIENCTDDRASILIQIDAGEVILDSSVTAGTFVFKGVGTLIDNSDGATVDSIGLISKTSVVTAINEAVGNEIQYASFNGGVTIDTVNGTDSSEYPYGTPLYPCKTVANSYAIRTARGFKKVYLINDLTLSGISDGILQGLSIEGVSGFRTSTVTFDNVLVEDCVANNLNITGALKSGSTAKAVDCHISSTSNVTLEAHNCFITSGIYLNTELYNCQINGDIKVKEGGRLSGVGIVFEGDYTTIDMQGHACTVSLDIDSGYFELLNSVDGCLAEFNLRGGEIDLNTNCTGGDFYAEGYGTLFGNPDDLGMVVKANHLIAVETISDEVWTHDKALRMLGLLQENQYLDQTAYTIYNGQKLLTSGRIRAYSDAGSVGSNSNVIATYQIMATWSGDEMQSYKVIKV